MTGRVLLSRLVTDASPNCDHSPVMLEVFFLRCSQCLPRPWATTLCLDYTDLLIDQKMRPQRNKGVKQASLLHEQ